MEKHIKHCSNSQKICKDTYNGLKQNAPAQTLAQVKYMQGVEPTGKLDKATYDALEKEKGNKIIRVKEENERAEKKKKELAINTNSRWSKRRNKCSTKGLVGCGIFRDSFNSRGRLCYCNAN